MRPWSTDPRAASNVRLPKLYRRSLTGPLWGLAVRTAHVIPTFSVLKIILFTQRNSINGFNISEWTAIKEKLQFLISFPLGQWKIKVGVDLVFVIESETLYNVVYKAKRRNPENLKRRLFQTSKVCCLFFKNLVVSKLRWRGKQHLFRKEGPR